MPIRRITLKSASIALVLLPIVSLSRTLLQNTPAPGNQAGPQNGAQTGTKTATVTSTKAGGPPPDQAGTPNKAVILDLGDPWDALKLDSKARVKLSFRNANIDNVIALLMKAS